MSDPGDSHNGVLSLRVDCGAASFLPVCPRCGWRGLPRASRADAAAVADRHAWSVHDDANAMNTAARRRLRAGVTV